MRKWMGSLGAVGLAWFVSTIAGCESVTCEDNATCANPGDGGAGEGGPLLPVGCDMGLEPKESASCVDDAVGIFVSPGGDDGHEGTKSRPVKTLGRALTRLGNRTRVYVCEGLYVDPVKLEGSRVADVYGGFSCTDWTYTGVKSELQPENAGVALEIVGVGGAGVTLADLDIAVQDGVAPGESSLGVVVRNSTLVSFRRVRIRAGEGQSAEAAEAPETNWYAADVSGLVGNGAIGGAGGLKKECACKSYGRSEGGQGGNGGSSARAGNGTADPMPVVMGGRTGIGGQGYVDFACGVGLPGSDGSTRGGGSGAALFGVLSEGRWEPAGGMAGEAGNPGAGGGGGGGGSTGGGGGGGCGGCGGSGGLGGLGGGSSVALLIGGSSVSFVDGELATSNAGNGGDGSGGEGGAGGGGGGNVGACGGGDGGNGAGGGGGGGGAGGVSLGIGHIGQAPEVTGTRITFGRAGTGGAFGTGGAGGTNVLGTAPSGPNGTAGKPGIAQEIGNLTP